MKYDELKIMIAEKNEITQKKTGEIIYDLFDIIREEMRIGESVKICDFGKFYTEKKPQRQGRNPQTGETITIQSKTVPKFKPFSHLKETVKNG